ncbi:MAG: helix-turn-helix transcriptional regulator [Lachnospiraceae bacterium]|nr:helix-turn-helix transcriptional regulator [Lachnospiraceae bacterium]
MEHQNQEINYEHFRNTLKDLTRSRHLYLKDVAEEIGITKTTISRYLTGDRNPDLEYVIRLANFFDVTVEYLLGLNDTRFRAVSDSDERILDAYALMPEEDKRIVDAVMEKYGSQG